MSLLQNFIILVSLMGTEFSHHRTRIRVLLHAISCLCTLGRKTISRFICFLGNDQVDWSAEYKLFSRAKWNTQALFFPILVKALPYCTGQYVKVAIDDTKLKKAGKKIKTASWQRDPMSPPFHTNFILGLRFLQVSLLTPLYQKFDQPCRALPIVFEEVPVPKRPKAKASQDEWERYRQEQKNNNLSHYFIRNLKGVRERLDQAGYQDKILIGAGDGSFCNKTCLSEKLDRTHIVARARKDARLCFRSSIGSRKTYADEKFTPEEVLQNKDIPWQTMTVHHGGAYRLVRFKYIDNVLWQSGTKTRPLRLIVIAPTPYKISRNGKTYYRAPAFLLSTDVEGVVEEYIQAYFDRWQIEVNHREEKDTLGVGQAQVRSVKSVARHPSFMVAMYSALLLAGIITFEDKREGSFVEHPRWRKKARRPSCLDLIAMLRKEIGMNPEILKEYGIKFDIIGALAKAAA